MPAVKVSRESFYREWLMARESVNPREFGVDMDREEFRDLMIDEFNTTYRGGWTIDELCLHPQEAIRFCNDVRRKHGFYDAPDDAILRLIMGRRKRPNE